MMKKILFASIYVVLLILIISGSVFIWAYGGQTTSSKIYFLEKYNLPIAKVQNHFISAKELTLRYNAVLTASGEHNTDNILWQNALEQLIDDQELLLLAEQNNLSPTADDLKDEYEAREAVSKIQTDEDLKSQLRKYNLSEQDFKQQVLTPFLAKQNILIWFNSQPSLNSELYFTAQEIQNQINSGTKFESLAEKYSEDTTGKSLEGDLGFVDTFSLLPEIRKQIESTKSGEVKVIPSRYGLHIMKLEEKKNNQLHLKQIFLEGEGAESWIASEEKQFTVKKFINNFK